MENKDATFKVIWQGQNRKYTRHKTHRLQDTRDFQFDRVVSKVTDWNSPTFPFPDQILNNFQADLNEIIDNDNYRLSK